jgi:periplasmic copper chaperone A
MPRVLFIEEAGKVTRWTRRLLVCAIAMLVAALAGCEAGADAPTLEFHQASSGTSTTVNGITVDDAFVLGPAPPAALPVGGEAGVFLSLYTHGSDRLVAASAPGAASSVRLVSGPVTLTPGTLVDLSGPEPQIVLSDLTSPLKGGQTVELVLDFETAGPVTLQVPVEPAAYDYTTYSPPPPTPTPTPARTHHAGSPAAASPSPTATP